MVFACVCLDREDLPKLNDREFIVKLRLDGLRKPV